MPITTNHLAHTQTRIARLWAGHDLRAGGFRAIEDLRRAVGREGEPIALPPAGADPYRLRTARRPLAPGCEIEAQPAWRRVRGDPLDPCQLGADDLAAEQGPPARVVADRQDDRARRLAEAGQEVVDAPLMGLQAEAAGTGQGEYGSDLGGHLNAHGRLVPSVVVPVEHVVPVGAADEQGVVDSSDALAAERGDAAFELRCGESRDAHGGDDFTGRQVIAAGFL